MDQGIADSLLEAALAEAREAVAEGGMPFGAVLAGADGAIRARGRNRQAQDGRWLAHAETECLAAYVTTLERREEMDTSVLVATEAPCPMCAGAIAVAGIGRCIVGEDHHCAGALDALHDAGIPVTVLGHQGCIDLVTTFRRDHPDRCDRFSAG